MDQHLQTAIDSAPAYTSGLVIAPCDRSEVYGVAANWSQASAPVYFYGDGKWETRQYQVADFRHKPSEALECEIAMTMEASGDEPDDTEVADICSNATEFTYREGFVGMRQMLESRGDYFSGNNPEDIANEWLDYGFDTESAEEWCEIGVWDACTAAEFRDRGYIPGQVADASSDLLASYDDPDELAKAFTDGNPIYSVCNNDTSIDVIVAAIEREE